MRSKAANPPPRLMTASPRKANGRWPFLSRVPSRFTCVEIWAASPCKTNGRWQFLLASAVSFYMRGNLSHIYTNIHIWGYANMWTNRNFLATSWKTWYFIRCSSKAQERDEKQRHKTPKVRKWRPKLGKSAPKGGKREPNEAQREPKGIQKGAKKVTKMIPETIFARSPKKVIKKSPTWHPKW